jgi:hypothetical protein
MAADAHYRDKDGEISRKHGHALIGTLRSSYGSRFAKGCTDSEKLSEALAKLDGPSLFKLVSDHKAGMLSISTSVAIIGLRSRTECPPWCEDLAEPPHYRPVHCRRSRLQVRVVL